MTSRGGALTRRGRAFAAALIVAGSMPVALDVNPFAPNLGADVADAELIQTFQPPAFTTNTTGAIDIVGNSLQTCDPNGRNGQFCADTLAGANNLGNGSYSMIWRDSDDGVLPAAISNQTTTSSSRATLAMPPGSTVLFAGLYWSGQSNNANRSRIDFLVPGGTGYQTLTGAVANAGSLYQGSLDVTNLVRAAGSGDYWAGDIQGFTGGNRYAAWSMVVVYENPGLPVRNLSVFDGFGRVTSGFRTLDVPIAGFLTPPFGPVNAEIGIVAYEGDRNIGGDQVRIDTNGGGTGNGLVNLTDASNPTTNFGNGSISDGGVATGEFVNNLSVDIDEFATVNVLEPALDNTTVRFQTTGDFWYPGVLTTAIDLFVPEFPQVTKTVRDLNGGDALPGDQLEYTISFENTGNDAARESIVRDVIPADTTFVPGSVQVINGNSNFGSGQFDGTQISVPIGDGATTAAAGGTLNPGEAASITFRVTIDQSARGTDIENEGMLDYVADTLDQPFTFTTNEVVTPVPPLARLRVEKTGTPNPVAPGDQVTWTIRVVNDGPNDATGVSVADAMVDNTYASSSIPCTGGVGATAVSCAIGTLAANTDTTFTVTTDTPPDLAVGTQVTNTATVSGNEEDDQPFNDSATARVTAIPVSDLEIAKSDAVDPVPAGGTIEYDLVVTNNGPSDAAGVRISDQPDGQFAITAIAVDTNPDGYTGVCDVGSRSCLLDQVLEVGDSVTVSVTAQVLPFAGAQVTNRAEVRSAYQDPNGADNVTTETTDIDAVADLSIDKTTLDAPVVAGEQVTYRVRVDNAGPSTAQAVTVTDALPSPLQLVSAVPTTGSCSGTTNITCSLGAINAGGQVDVIITADVPADATGANLVNSATVSSPTDPTDSTDSATDPVVNSADLRIVKTLIQANPIVAGTAFDFTIEVFNDGPSDTSGPYTVSDNVPAPLVVTSLTGDGCPAPSNAITCTSSTPIPAGGSVVIDVAGNVPGGAATPSVDNTATVTYADDPNTPNNSSTAQVDLAAEADVRIDKEWVGGASPTVIAGQQATFTLQVTNDGPSVADTVVIDDLLPVGMTVVSATGTGITCNAPGTSTLSCSADASMNASDSLTVTVVVAVPADAPAGSVNNTGSVASATPDRNPGNNDDVDPITIQREADLSITKVASDDTPNAGETITYTVEVTNNGPSSANSSFLGDPLVGGLTLDAGSIQIDGAAPVAPRSCTSSGNAVNCDLDVLAVGATVQITYDATVSAATPPATVLPNTATASSPDDPTANSAQETVTVGSEATLTVTKSDSVDPATPGGPLDYTITIDNAGPSDALDVVLGDTLPAEYAASAASSPDGTCDTSVSCTFARIPAGGSVSILIRGTVDASATGSLVNVTDVPTSTTTNLLGTSTGNETTALTPSADLSITKAASPTTIDAGGGPVTYTIAVANAGPSDAADVEVGDTLPAGFVVDSITPSQGSCASATTFPCDLGTVDAGGSADVIVVGHFPSTVAPGPTVNTATVESPTDPNAQPGSPKTADAPVTVTRSADVSVTKSGPVTVVAGETRVSDGNVPPSFIGGLQYTIAVRNDGPSQATDVELTDLLDTTIIDAASITSARITSSAGTCTPGTTITCDLGDLDDGDLVTITINVDVRADATIGVDVLSNTASITSSSTDPTPGNDSSTVDTDVTAAGDLRVEKAAPALVTAGETFDYTITVTNDGPSDATDVDVADTAPAGVTFGAVTSTPNVCTSLPCAVGDLADGDSVVITVSATVDAAAAATDGTLGNADDVVNTATVTSSTADPTPTNDSASVRSDVDREADIEVVAKTDSADPVQAGTSFSYTVSVRNNGPSTATDAELTDDVPAGATLVASSLPAGCTTPGGATAAGTTITCDLGGLASGQTATRSFEVLVDAGLADGSTITNQATAGATETDPVPDNNGSSNANGEEQTTVSAVADVSIAKVADLAAAVPGQPLTYTLTVGNAGPSVATSVVVTDDVSAIFETGSVTATPSASAPAGFTCSVIGANVVTCTGASVPVGTFTIDIAGTVLASATTDLSNTATIQTPTDPGTQPTPKSATIDTPVAPSADVRIEKVGTPISFEPGEAATYTITVTNDGPSDAQNVVISDAIPADFTNPITATPGCSITSPNLSCSFASIGVGAANAITVTVTGTISDRAVGTVANTAVIDSSGTPDPTPGNNTGSSSNPVVPEADLQISKATVTS
ncbi:MAG: isopeptide-forming domain-containing fimbrial protein, partial [Actinomycetota bacterium]